MDPIEKHITDVKTARQLGDSLIQHLKALPPSRETSLAITKFQEGVMWLGMTLKGVAEANPSQVQIRDPYPGSKDPSNPTIHPTADGLKL